MRGKMNDFTITGIAWHAVCMQCKWNMVSDEIKWLREAMHQHGDTRKHRVEIVPANGETYQYDEKRFATRPYGKPVVSEEAVR